MRAALAAGAAAGLVGLGALALVGGRAVEPPASSLARQAESPAAVAPAGRQPAAPTRPADAQFPTSAVPADSSGFERIPPRQPLSRLSLALPPEPKVSDEWDGTLLHRAVASAAGVIEAQGHRVSIAGADLVEADEQCSYEGKSWNCGVRARTAFRALLRGRAPTCALPPEAASGAVAARCRIGKQDLGEWLVANGWARAEAGGPYAAAEARAREKRLGIFGPPPDTSPILVRP